jgi:RND superfamily putative drug exporter
MATLLSTEHLARSSARRPWLTIAAWAVLLVAGFVSAMGIGDVLTTDGEVYQETESARADRLIHERFGMSPEAPHEVVVVQAPGRTIDDPTFQALVADLTASFRAMDGNVITVASYLDAHDPSLISADRSTVLIHVGLGGTASDAEKNSRPVLDLVSAKNGVDGFTVLSGGHGSLERAWTETAEKDLQKLEMIGVPVALVVLLVVFGALVAAGLPILVGIFSIIIAVGISALIGRAFELSMFVTNMIMMMGLAVGIDYSLLIVQRFREERRNGRDVHDAIARSGATATRAVFFSGMTVVVALSGLLLVPDSIFRSLALGAIIVVLVALAAALTLLPAVLRLLGDRVDRVRVRVPFRRRSPEAASGRFWAWTTGLVTRHAAISAIASVAFLALAAAPYLTMKLGSSGIGSLPRNSDVYQVFSILDRDFNAGLLAPARIVVDGRADDPAVLAGIERLRERLATDSAFGSPELSWNDQGNLAVIDVPVSGAYESRAAARAVDRLRSDYIPAAFNGTRSEVLVTGPTAETTDYVNLIRSHTPLVFAFVLGLSFLILLVVFRSTVVPVKAIIMNLLSVGAAYGLMVLVFQHGIGHEIFGFGKVERIDAWIPLFLFAILFGLSMDYHVFLLSRIRERFDATGDNLESVAYGVRSTAGMITGAALIMVAVFSGMAAGDLVMFQQMGFGLAVAIILDATVVRVVLVPASMALLGDRNWYLPGWLGWLPKLELDGHHAEPAMPVYGAAGQ